MLTDQLLETRPLVCAICGGRNQVTARYCGDCGTAVAVTMSTVYTLEFVNGQRLIVDNRVLVGRNPSPTLDEPRIELFRLDDTTQTVSKTHALFGVDDGALWVIDRHSANGISVNLPNQPRQKLTPGQRFTLTDGYLVAIGDQIMTVRQNRA